MTYQELEEQINHLLRTQHNLIADYIEEHGHGFKVGDRVVWKDRTMYIQSLDINEDGAVRAWLADNPDEHGWMTAPCLLLKQP